MKRKISASHTPPTTVASQTYNNTVQINLNSHLHTPWTLLHPTKELFTATVESAKRFLDALAVSVSDSQSARLQSNRKRKRSEIEPPNTGQILQIKELYVDGFTSGQIWEQATRILDSAACEVGRDSTISSYGGRLPSKKRARHTSFDNTSFWDCGSEHSDSENSVESSSNQEKFDSGYEVGVEFDDSQSLHSADGAWEARSANDDSMDGDADSKFSEENQADVYKQDPFGLNDGFFSIDDFNKQSEFFERQDAKGGIDDDDDDESDEEINWHADPLFSAKTMSATSLKAEENSDMSDEEGPIFGNVDPKNNSDSEDDGHVGEDATGWTNTNDIKYTDFFAPPPRKASDRKLRPLPKTQPNEPTIENDIEHAIADVRRDLFEDNNSTDAELDSDGDLDSGVQRSSHERHRARIADEIRRLEAANVAKKEWMLAGEAKAGGRPMNSLIEEDLEFERIGRPVSVVTKELTEDIESLIKRRILAKEFDEVIRRHPGTTSAGEIPRRGKLEIDDSKPQKSLSELYEMDHLHATNSNYVDTKDSKLKREHADITGMWKEISSQLDTLSNWHYKPKNPQASINVVADVATVLMEDARPTVGSAVGGSEALAPQEIYTPGEDSRTAGELVLKNGISVSREEMTREEKARWRRQHKEELRKANRGDAKRQVGRRAERQQLVSDLKKGGVKVIGKQGEVTDVYGDKVNRENARNGIDALKL